MGAAYNLGYLTGIRAADVLANHVVRSLPRCPYPRQTVQHRSWMCGLIDSIRDRKAFA